MDINTSNNKNNKNIFNKNGRCRDVKTPKVCKQGREVNVHRTQN